MALAFSLPVWAAPEGNSQAPELTGSMSVSLSTGQAAGALTDDNVSTYVNLPGNSSITISHVDGIRNLYILWNKIPGSWTYTINGVSYEAGADGFLHEYVQLPETTAEISIDIPEGGAALTDIHCFGEGAVPEWVQIWEPSCDRADILLLSTHADDEHLFFAGILPYYAGERGGEVQVVYMTNHWDTVSRPHEQLNGLWTVGVRNYPIVGPFPDDAASLGSKRESVETVLQRALRVYDEEALTEFQVEMIRRFQPQVVIGHDEAGEYRHGAHIVNTFTLKKALEMSGDGTYYPDLAEKYGTWDVPKTYLHLYGENQIVMDWDIPLESFGGLTAFEVSKLGYGCHLSQQWTWFTRWVDRDKAAHIDTYSPCHYGLYRSTIGEDIGKKDFLENIITYREQAEILAREEAERIAAQEAELIAAEASAKTEEAEKVARDGAEQSELQERENADTSGPDPAGSAFNMHVFAAVAVIGAICLCVLLLLWHRKRRERSRR